MRKEVEAAKRVSRAVNELRDKLKDDIELSGIIPVAYLNNTENLHILHMSDLITGLNGHVLKNRFRLSHAVKS